MNSKQGFEQVSEGAAVVYQETLPGQDYDGLSVNDGTQGFVTVTMFSQTRSRVGVTQYLTKDEALALAAHMTKLANAL